GAHCIMESTDDRTGELRSHSTGILLLDVARTLAARMGVPVVPVGHPTIPEMLTCLTAGACDLGFMGPDRSRAGVDFSPPILQLEYTFLAPPAPSFQGIAAPDRAGVPSPVLPVHPPPLPLAGMVKHAELTYAATPDPTFEPLRTGQADAFASVRPVLLAYAAKLPGSRVLEDHYGANLVGIVVPKGRTERLAYISEFIEQPKASGLVRQAIDRAGF